MALGPAWSKVGRLRKTSERLTGRRHDAAYRINTFPFIHLDMFHAFLNILALTPLMESFEAEHGTLTSIALFIGRGSLPLVS